MVVDYLSMSSVNFAVTGKWKATTGRPGDELAFKHVVEIDCFKSTNTCTEAQANIVGTEPDIGVQYYEIIHWDENGLIAKSDDAECMTNELHINFQDQNVMAIDSPRRGAVGLQGSCKSPALSHTQTYKLVAR
jgi:hypothetical protein